MKAAVWLEKHNNDIGLVVAGQEIQGVRKALFVLFNATTVPNAWGVN